jgi:spore maturation protein CgeB
MNYLSGFKILVVGKYLNKLDSYDYINIVESLIDLGHLVKIFDTNLSREENTANILKLCKEYEPDLLFIIPVEEEIDLNKLTTINNKIKKLVYFFDDTWRINYSLKWLDVVDYAVTSDINWKLNFNKFKHKIIYSHFTVNIDRYLNYNNKEKNIDISFVGQYHPYREWIINKLKSKNLNVKVYGEGWKNSKVLSHHEMVELFNNTKINLNLSNCVNYDLRFLFDLYNNTFLSILKSIKLILKSLYKKDMKIYEMVKGRFFEINACGGFQLAFYAQGLEQQYNLGTDIAIFTDINELIRKIEYFLIANEERELIALNGYNKTLQIHNSRIRLNHILSNIF